MKLRLVHFAAIALGIAVAILLTTLAGGGEHCRCAHCGCQSSCQKICRLVCEDKKVPVVCWGCKCEDFCLPGHSKRECKHCEDVCDDCDDPEVCHKPKTFSWYDWVPSCKSHIYTKTKLMKKTVTKTIPSYKWVVEDVCCECEKCCPVCAVEPGAEVPPPPKVAAKLIPGKIEASAVSATLPR